MENEYAESSQQRQNPRPRSTNSTSSRQSQRRSFSQSRPTQSPPPGTAQSEQDVITPSPLPGTALPQRRELQGVEDLQKLPLKTLENEYGTFQMQRGVQWGGKGDFDQSYSAEISMTPNKHTRSSKSLHASEIDLVQVVRSGTGNNWNTTPTELGHRGPTDESGRPIDSEGKPQLVHRAELAEQQTGTGWRVDQSLQDTPFHSESHTPDNPPGKHHRLKKSDPVHLIDRPEIAGEGYKFDAMTTAMDKKTGKEFGTVEWGFRVEQNDQGESTIRERTPTFLEDNLKLGGQASREAHQRNGGRIAAYDRWNQAAPGKEQFNEEQARQRAEGRAQQEAQLKDLLAAAEEGTEERAQIEAALEDLQAQKVEPPKKVTRLPRRG